MPSSPPNRLHELVTRARNQLPPMLVEVVEAVPRFQKLTAEWHRQHVWPADSSPTIFAYAGMLHRYNFHLWHTEDTARRPHAADSLIAQCKRSIDMFNQQRHDQIEKLDELLFTYLYEQHNRARRGAALHSETVGGLLDRLSVLALKMYHMRCEAERQDATGSHRQHCRQRLTMLTEQYEDLWACLCHLCVDLWSGRKTFKVYRQFKMYNDPELNPEIYRYRTARQSSEL